MVHRNAVKEITTHRRQRCRPSPLLSRTAHIQNIYNPSLKSDCVHCLKTISEYTYILHDGKTICVPCCSNLRKLPGSYHVINKL